MRRHKRWRNSATRCYSMGSAPSTHALPAIWRATYVLPGEGVDGRGGATSCHGHVTLGPCVGPCGVVFMSRWSPVALGPCHVGPVSRWARGTLGPYRYRVLFGPGATGKAAAPWDLGGARRNASPWRQSRCKGDGTRSLPFLTLLRHVRSPTRSVPPDEVCQQGKALASFPVDVPMPWAYQCHPQGRGSVCRKGEEACAEETIRALERLPVTFLEPQTRPRIQRSKLR
jgi:hypothetical protein